MAGLLSCFSPLLPSQLRPAQGKEDEKAELSEKAGLVRPRARLAGSDRPQAAKADTTERVWKLREVMWKEGLGAYVIPTGDAHNSEVPGDCDKRRMWISGFTGSAGVAVVTADQALLFTDSRYYIQAAHELDTNWTLMKVGMKDVKSWSDWLLDLPTGTTIGIDPTLSYLGSTPQLIRDLAAKSLTLTFPAYNLVDSIWPDRPPRSCRPIVAHPLRFSGRASAAKLADVRKALAALAKPSQTTPSLLVTDLDEVAWLLNLRGSDIEHNPVFYSYVIVHPTKEEGYEVYAQLRGTSGVVRERSMVDGGLWREYADVVEGVKGLKGPVVADAKANWALVQAIGQDRVTLVRSPVEQLKAVKNAVEVEGFRRAYLRDGASWVRWAAWLEEQIQSGKQVSEWDAAQELTKYRQGNEHFAGLAYANISATGPNAALPHYEPTASSSSLIDPTTPYLNDSGAQYLDGTIDCTRTVHFGKPSAAHKRAYTRVLQGHIAIDRLVFPEGTTGNLVEALARAPLWSEGMNYMHGTGHGVGEYLSVHESPPGLGASATYGLTPFTPGHVLSNEPGYYEEGQYGIRIESVVCVKGVTTRRSFGDRAWLGFERFTTVPIQTRMVDWKLMSEEDKKWLKAHNALCRDKLMPILKAAGDKRALRYLARQ